MSKSLQDNSTFVTAPATDELILSDAVVDQNTVTELEKASVKSKIKLMESIVGTAEPSNKKTTAAVTFGKTACENEQQRSKSERSASSSSAASSTSSSYSSCTGGGNSPPLSPKQTTVSDVLLSITNSNSTMTTTTSVAAPCIEGAVAPGQSVVYQVEKLKKEGGEGVMGNEKRKTVKELLSQFETTKNV
jgi:hypothetical protein